MQRRNAAGVLTVAATAVLTLSAKEWSATLRSQNGSAVTGSATAQAAAGDSLVVQIQVKGGKAGDSNPWHLHSGGCDSSGAVIGEPSRYAAMTIGADGGAQATARVQAALAVGVPYSVNVHRSSADMTPIACGNLRPVAGPQP